MHEDAYWALQISSVEEKNQINWKTPEWILECYLLNEIVKTATYWSNLIGQLFWFTDFHFWIELNEFLPSKIRQRWWILFKLASIHYHRASFFFQQIHVLNYRYHLRSFDFHSNSEFHRIHFNCTIPKFLAH